MIAESWLDPRISRVTVEQARRYMEDHGWERLPSRGQKLLVFGGRVDDDGLPITLILCSSERMSDYLNRLTSLVGALGIIEGRYAGDVLSDMLAINPTPQTNGASAEKEAISCPASNTSSSSA